MNKFEVLMGKGEFRKRRATEDVLRDRRMTEAPDLTIMRDPDVAALYVAVLFSTIDEDLILSLDFPSLWKLCQVASGKNIKVPPIEKLYESLVVTYALYHLLSDSETIRKKDLDMICEYKGFDSNKILKLAQNVYESLSLSRGAGKSLIEFLSIRDITMSEVEKKLLNYVNSQTSSKELIDWYQVLSLKMGDVAEILRKLLLDKANPAS